MGTTPAGVTPHLKHPPCHGKCGAGTHRRADLPLLVEHAVARLNAAAIARRGRQIERVEPDAMRAMLGWTWPGNVRELKNTIEYAFVVGSGPLLRRDDLPPEMLSTSTSTSTSATATATTPASRPRGRPKKSVDPLELVRIEEALRNTGGDVGAAAAMLGMSRATLWRKRQSPPSSLS